MTDLRAALNASARKAKAPADVLAAIRDGLAAPEDPDAVREKQVLPDGDVRRIVEAAFELDQDFGNLVMILAATGARFSQVDRLTVADIQLDQLRLMMPASRKGKQRRAVPPIAVPASDDVASRLRILIAGRAGHEQLLQRWYHEQVARAPGKGNKPEWERKERRGWGLATRMMPFWREALTAAGLPKTLVPYCLRHSSIVRSLRIGLPVTLVAKSHNTSVAMIEKHYAAWIVDAAEDLLRRAAVPMTPAPVSRLRAVVDG